MKVESQKSRVESRMRSERRGARSEICSRFRTRSSLLAPRSPRSALTLIELLVVIIILTTIVAAAIPIMTPADDDRRLREASRAVNTFISSAQARAIALNRPVGIALKRLSQDTQRIEDRGVCVQVYYVEQQPPYSGFDENSRARLAFYRASNPSLYGGSTALVRVQFLTRGSSVVGADGLPSGWDPDLFPAGMIRPGDVIEINGTRYQLLAESADTNLTPTIDANGYFASNTGRNNANQPTQIVGRALNDTGQMLNMTHDDEGYEIGTPNAINTPFFTLPAPYKILRQATPASDEPYQMPEGTAIDLRASGLGYSENFYWPEQDDDPGDDSDAVDNDDPVVILFSPEGKVSRLRYNKFPKAAIFDEPVAEDLFLLVGKRSSIPAPALDRDTTLNMTDYGLLKDDDARGRVRAPINWLVGSSRWIMIGSQSGRIATIGNTFVDPSAIMQVYTTSTPPLAAMSEDMRAQQIVAARELTRQTTQATGR